MNPINSAALHLAQTIPDPGIDSDTTTIPGVDLLLNLIAEMRFIGLILCIGTFVAGALMWNWQSGGYERAQTGKKLMAVSCITATLIVAAPVILNIFSEGAV